MKLTFLCLLLSVVPLGPLAQAQQNAAAQDRVGSKPIPGNCEDNILNISHAHHAAGTDGTIIAIARLGDGERNRILSHRRLHNVRVYLIEFGWQRDPATVITAEGEKTKGYGRVELYVRGVFFGSLAVRRNQDLLVGSCEPDSIRPVRAERNLYPYLDTQPRRSAKKP